MRLTAVVVLLVVAANNVHAEITRIPPTASLLWLNGSWTLSGKAM